MLPALDVHSVLANAIHATASPKPTLQTCAGPQIWGLNGIMLAGSFALGLVIAWLLRTYLDRTEKLEFKALVGSASILLGGATLAFLRAFTPDTALPQEFLAYPIGLFVGVVIYPLVSMIDNVVSEVLRDREHWFTLKLKRREQRAREREARERETDE